MGKQIDLEEMIRDVKDSVDAPKVLQKAMEESMNTDIYYIQARVKWRVKRGNKGSIGYKKGTPEIPLRLVTTNLTDPLKDPVTLNAVEGHLNLKGKKYFGLEIEEIYGTLDAPDKHGNQPKNLGKRSQQAIEQDNK